MAPPLLPGFINFKFPANRANGGAAMEEDSVKLHSVGLSFPSEPFSQQEMARWQPKKCEHRCYSYPACTKWYWVLPAHFIQLSYMCFLLQCSMFFIYICFND